MMTCQILFSRTNPDSGRSNYEYYIFFFSPKEYRIMLAVDRYYYIDVHIFDNNLVKNAFARCRVPFCGFRAF